MADLKALGGDAKAWPFAEARTLLQRVGASTPAKGYVLFETGYGPSGLPHIGTFGEVVRTTMVRRAFETISDIPTRLFAFSDDMDGLRKVPDNVPNQEMMAQHLGKPLTQVPDPFGTHESFGHHNNARLRAFLDTFGFEYEFRSATDCYLSGEFDATLLEILRLHDDITAVIKPTLGPERRETYSPFLPAHRAGAAGEDFRNEARRRHRRVRERGRRAGRDGGDRRQVQTAVEGRLGDALEGALGRLRDVRQGPDRFRAAVESYLQNSRRDAAGELHLRAVPRRQGRENLKVARQRPVGRGMA